MSNLQIIEALCDIVDMCMDTIRDLATKLENVSAYDLEERAAVERAESEYRTFLRRINK